MRGVVPPVLVAKGQDRHGGVAAPWLRRWRFDGRDEHLRPAPPPPAPEDLAVDVCIWVAAVWVWVRAVARAFFRRRRI